MASVEARNEIIGGVMEVSNYIYGVGGIIIFIVLWQVLVVAHYHERGRLQGIREACDRMIRGVSRHYEVVGQPIPENVAKAVDTMMDRVNARKTWKEKNEIYLPLIWALGDEMGKACVASGIEIGEFGTNPRDGEIRIDLTAREIVNLSFLAHLGFEKMITGYAGMSGDISFNDEADAEQATEAIRKLERNRPKEMRDESDPYAMAFNRQTMIWDRYGTASQKPAT